VNIGIIYVEFCTHPICNDCAVSIRGTAIAEALLIANAHNKQYILAMIPHFNRHSRQIIAPAYTRLIPKLPYFAIKIDVDRRDVLETIMAEKESSPTFDN